MIVQIDRDDDPRLESFRHVGDPEWLKQAGLFVGEGRLVVERLIGDGRYEIESILVTPAAFRALETRLTIASAVFVADQRLVNGVTGFNFHRRCLAIVKRPPADLSLSVFSSARRLIALEGVGNPDNIGGIFRSVLALGADGVILDPAAGDPLYRKAVRTSMGASLRVPFVRASPWPDCLELLRRQGFTIGALAPRGASTIDDFAERLPSNARVVLVAGAEGSGLSDAVESMSDVTVRIPIDPRSDSLNVVVAISIALHRIAR